MNKRQLSCALLVAAMASACDNTASSTAKTAEPEVVAHTAALRRSVFVSNWNGANPDYS